MRFTQTLFAGAAFVAAALALEINEYPPSVEAGKTYTVTYSPADNKPTTFILRKGVNENLDTVTTLTTTATGGKFEWTVDEDLENASDYALMIEQAGVDPNYIGPIALSGGEDPKPSSSSKASSSAASSTESESSSATATISITTMLSSTVSATPTASSNGTASLSRTPTETETQGAPESTGAASALASSPLALIFGAAAAMMYLN